MSVPKRVRDRISSNLKRFRGILEGARARDVSEADTVTIVKDMLCEVFGFDKYTEITGEFAIRGTYCDLAVRIDNSVRRLIEVKAIGIKLSERHTRQAVQYGASEGIEWVVLTNGIVWRVYHILFRKPIATELVYKIDVMDADLRDDVQLERLFLLTRESVAKGALKAFKQRQDAVNRYVVTALLLENDAVDRVLRTELRRATEVRVDRKELLSMLKEEVVKRDAQEGEPAEAARKLVNRAERQAIRKSRSKKPSAKPAPEATAPATVGADDEAAV